jgi:hypothetical protein
MLLNSSNSLLNFWLFFKKELPHLIQKKLTILFLNYYNKHELTLNLNSVLPKEKWHNNTRSWIQLKQKLGNDVKMDKKDKIWNA